VKSDPKIWRFFPKKDSPVTNSSNAVIVETPIQQALDNIIQQVNIAPNMIKEKHDRDNHIGFRSGAGCEQLFSSLLEKNPKI
jgi:2-phosphoglycerate kinase